MYSHQTFWSLDIMVDYINGTRGFFILKDILKLYIFCIVLTSKYNIFNIMDFLKFGYIA